MSLEQGVILKFRNQLKIREYANACMIFDLVRGKSKGREWKASVFFFIAMIMLLILMMENFNFTKVPVCAIVLLICMYMCSHYLYMLPKKAKLKGEHIYKSSKLLSKEYEFEIYQDFLIFKNQFEFLKKYYSQITDCVETNELFVLIGGVEHPIIVISKRCLDEKQCVLLSEHFQNEMVHQYRRTKSTQKRQKKS